MLTECHCTCHLPMGFKLAPGEKPAPIMRPCTECASAHENAPDPVSIDAVAATIAENLPSGMTQRSNDAWGRFIARKLAAGGFLRTPEDRTLVIAAGHAVAYHEACLSLAAGPSTEDYAAAWDLLLAAMSDLAEARRAAGGTEAQP